MARARMTQVITAPAYPVSVLGVPNATFIVMLVTFGGTYYATDTLLNLNVWSIFLGAVPAGAIWGYVARRFAKDPHIEARWRAMLVLLMQRKPRPTRGEGRCYVPTSLPLHKHGKGYWRA